jgi:hypothetical protein
MLVGKFLYGVEDVFFNTAVDFRGRLRFPRAAGEPPLNPSLREFNCPAAGLRGTCHKPNRPRRQRTPSWPIRLMPPASEQSPSTFLIGVFVFHSNQPLETPLNQETSLNIYFLISPFSHDLYFNRAKIVNLIIRSKLKSPSPIQNWIRKRLSSIILIFLKAGIVPQGGREYGP